MVHVGSEAHPASCSECTGVIPPGVKRPEREVYQSPAASDEFKDEWRCTSIPRICLHDMDMDDFTVLHTDLIVYLLQAGYSKLKFQL